jgi:hypothetical protein
MAEAPAEVQSLRDSMSRRMLHCRMISLLRSCGVTHLPRMFGDSLSGLPEDRHVIPRLVRVDDFSEDAVKGPPRSKAFAGFAEWEAEPRPMLIQRRQPKRSPETARPARLCSAAGERPSSRCFGERSRSSRFHRLLLSGQALRADDVTAPL